MFKKNAKKIYDLINRTNFKFTKRAKENDELYGSIKPKEISLYFSEQFKETVHPSQIDLKKNQSSGLIDAQNKLNNLEGVGFTFLDSSDVQRHSLVKKILDKYQKS